MGEGLFIKISVRKHQKGSTLRNGPQPFYRYTFIRINYMDKLLNKRDLIAINQQFAAGKIVNGSSLDFALEQSRRSPNWFKNLCLLTRNMLLDNVFEDGNKRTAAAVIMTCLDLEGYHYHPDKIGLAVLKITKDNITKLNLIERLIHHAVEVP